MSRPARSIAFVLLSVGTAAALAACGQSPPARTAAAHAVTSTSSPAVTSAPQSSPATSAAGSANATPAGTVAGNQQNGDQQDAQPGRIGRCGTSALRGQLVGGSPGAGQRYATLVVTNISGSTCTLYGYSGLQLLGPDGRSLPTQLQRTANPGPRLVMLAPGKTASQELHWGVVPGPGESDTGQCEPPPTAASVIPPDETTPLRVGWTFGPVCQSGRMDGSAFH